MLSGLWQGYEGANGDGIGVQDYQGANYGDELGTVVDGGYEFDGGDGFGYRNEKAGADIGVWGLLRRLIWT